jgi:hypothetical protein
VVSIKSGEVQQSAIGTDLSLWLDGKTAQVLRAKHDLEAEEFALIDDNLRRLGLWKEFARNGYGDPVDPLVVVLTVLGQHFVAACKGPSPASRSL